ncbi:MAG: DUF2971 domain-containing protein [Thermoanaerobaculia bacterium]
MTSTDQRREKAFPSVLHRYRPPEDLEAGYARETLIDNKLYATSPARFNDPFDCRANLSFEGAKQQWRGFFAELFRKTLRHQTSSQRKAAVAEALARKAWKDPDVQNRFLRDLQDIVDQTGVICFCESATIPLMWSHYAKGHTGYCLRFRTNYFPFSQAMPVRYTTEFPRPSALDTPQRQVEALFITKAIWWEYECEWRFVGYEHGLGHRAFAPEALEAVIVGHRASDQLREELLRLAALRTSPTPVFQARPSTTRFELDLIQLS